MKKYLSSVFIFSFIIFFVFPPSLNAQDMILLETTLGNIKIKLYDETPNHKSNFIRLVNEGYYNNILFHRVIPDFMIQAGDPESKTAIPGQQLGSGGPGYTIPAEFHPAYFHKKGALAAARLADNINPNKESSGSQFYIVQGQIFSSAQLNTLVKNGSHAPFSPEQIQAYTTIGGTPHLDNAYTVFGEVVEGLDVVNKISIVQTDARNRPTADIKIIKASIID